MEAEQAREALLARLGVLTGREEAISQHLRGEDGRLGADFGDIANFTAGDEVLEGLEDAALAEIEAIQAALGRLGAGAWGVCVSCGESIDARRLDVLPSAAKCADCARTET
jgi:RNA polymerase-binding transcription factor DksA